MKIYGIANTVNFGYNKELNDKVNKKLENAKGNKEFAQTLLAMNKMCNETEDKLRKAEKEHKTQLVDKYFDIFITMKSAVTNEIDNRFPLIHYRKQELDGYKQEIKRRHIDDESHWLMAIVEDLKLDQEISEIVTNVKTNKQNNGDIKYIILDADKPAKTENDKKVEEKEKKKGSCKFVEKFEPTEYSPKGFESLGGMAEIKEALRDKIISPVQDPEGAKLDEVEYGKKAPRGELFYGPPGCGKTSIIEAVSMESGIPLYKLKISKAGSIYVNGSAKNIQQGYEYVKKIAEDTGKPVFLAMDEMESMTGKRNGNNEEDSKVVGTLLQIIEEARGNNVIILGATNFYDMLDDAIKSRFDDKIYIGLPDTDTRRSVLKIHLARRKKGQALASNDKELDKVVKLTEGFSNRDIAILTDKAALIARADKRRDIVADDFIIPVKENQNMKVKEDLYKDKSRAKSIGFAK